MKPAVKPAVPVTILLLVIVSALIGLVLVLRSEIGRAVLGVSACLMVILTLWAARAKQVQP